MLVPPEPEPDLELKLEPDLELKLEPELELELDLKPD